MLETRLRTFADNTGGGGSSAVYAQSGDTFLVYSASTGLTNERVIAASDNITIVSSGTSFLISANTGALNTAGSGLTLTGSTLTVNTNIRDKILGFFMAGSLAVSALASSAMVYIPFNMEMRDIRLAVSHSAGGQNIRIRPTLWNSTLKANSALFSDADRPQIITNNLVGSQNAFGSTVLTAGSFLGIQVDSIGTTVIGSNLTITFVVRTS